MAIPEAVPAEVAGSEEGISLLPKILEQRDLQLPELCLPLFEQLFNQVEKASLSSSRE
jgi:hypothetical protein